jgi:hypothetical protein
MDWRACEEEARACDKSKVKYHEAYRKYRELFQEFYEDRKIEVAPAHTVPECDKKASEDQDPITIAGCEYLREANKYRKWTEFLKELAKLENQLGELQKQMYEAGDKLLECLELEPVDFVFDSVIEVTHISASWFPIITVTDTVHARISKFERVDQGVYKGSSQLDFQRCIPQSSRTTETFLGPETYICNTVEETISQGKLDVTLSPSWSGVICFPDSLQVNIELNETSPQVRGTCTTTHVYGKTSDTHTTDSEYGLHGANKSWGGYLPWGWFFWSALQKLGIYPPRIPPEWFISEWEGDTLIVNSKIPAVGPILDLNLPEFQTTYSSPKTSIKMKFKRHISK